MIDSRNNSNARNFRGKLTMMLASLLLLTGVFAQEQDDDAVILRVDDRTETVGSFNDRFNIAIRGLVASMGIPMSDDLLLQLDGMKAEYLTQLASDLALLNEAEAQGVTISDEEVDEIVAQSISTIPEEEVPAVLESAGFRDLDHYGDMVRETELIQRYLDGLFAEMEFSDDELNTWWDANAAQFATGEQVCASHILVEDVDLANELITELEEGADFAELATEHSIDPGSGQNGGDLGCFGRGMMVAPFDQAAFEAEVDQVVGPIETGFGQHIILVHEKVPASEPALEDFREQAEIGVANERIADIVTALVDSADVESHPELLNLAPPASDVPAGEAAPADEEAPAEEAPADEAPATDEAPADEAPADEAPADEAPADEAPASEPAAE